MPELSPGTIIQSGNRWGVILSAYEAVLINETTATATMGGIPADAIPASAPAPKAVYLAIRTALAVYRKPR